MTEPTSSLPDPSVVLRLEVGRGRVLVAVVGRVASSRAAADELRAGLRRALSADCSQVVLDLARVEDLDDVGVRIVLATHRRLRAQGGDLVVWRPVSAVELALAAYGDELRVLGPDDDPLTTPVGLPPTPTTRTTATTATTTTETEEAR
ncbi:STAS domain-containing protein [Nocardioides litoris]|uniref:STAS domain-containing protein n=1 Tax=Nocardioides litoris TaxID=1926648 RepID=UPI001476EB7E|nr:STAS domain-containing protein [Nocardioides litoris]